MAHCSGTKALFYSEILGCTQTVIEIIPDALAPRRASEMVYRPIQPGASFCRSGKIAASGGR
jgi:hypothetical protein